MTYPFLGSFGPAAMMGGVTDPPPHSFRAFYDDIVNRTTYTFASSDLGTPDSTRMIVVAVAAHGTGVVSTVDVDGTGATSAGTPTAHDNGKLSVWQAASIANPTGTITVTFSGGMNDCSICVFALYPASQTPTDYASGTATATTVLASNLAKTAGGFTVLVSAATAVPRTNVITQNGAETVTEHADNDLDGLISRTFASHLNTATTTTDDYTATINSLANVAIVAASWA